MNDQENIREIRRLGIRAAIASAQEGLAEEKQEKELKLQKEHLERLAVLHRRARGEKW
tara:strand:+ start:174 stop:347 length:174 start_codon:yes stop_codon:yes gene_type:complete